MSRRSPASGSGSGPTALDLARTIAAAADEKGGEQVEAFEVGEILAICDVFVIVSASNTRLVGAIANEVEEQVQILHDRKPTAVEGLDGRRWVLMDYGDVILHVFLDEERTFYRLERLYSDAPRVDLALPAPPLPVAR